jgi:FkbM family methyltransferase
MTTQKMNISYLIKCGFLIPRAIKNRLMRAFRLYILRDEFTIAARKWFKDLGDETLRFDYPLDPESVVFDLGGYKGDFAYEINRRYGCFVYVFEPVKTFYEECAERFIANPKVKCYNFGLSDKTGTAHISNEDNGSSIIKNKFEDREEIALKQFKETIDELGLEKLDLVKMNIEGAEFLIIPHLLESDLMSKIRYLQVQFHTFYPNAVHMREIIRQEISKTHVENWNYPFVWESWSVR